MQRQKTSNIGIRGLDDAELIRTYDIFIEHCDGNYSELGRRLGIKSPAAKKRIKRYHQLDLGKTRNVELPEFPEEGLSAEEILDHMEKDYETLAAYEEATEWFTIKIKDPLPCAINWFGDPHLGSKGFSAADIRRDIAIVCDVKNPGLYAANIGDTGDNWGGRLTALWADNELSRTTEYKLAKWFLAERGIPWIVWLFGNHDTMAHGFVDYLKANNAAAIPMLDWRARFKLVFPNGAEFKIDAAHNHKGQSWFHELQGQIRAALQTGFEADLYIAGHHHDWAVMQHEAPDNRVITYARCRGYKMLDDYSRKGGFKKHLNGQSIVTVFDPTPAHPTQRVRTFASTAEGAEFLAYLRSRK